MHCNICSRLAQCTINKNCIKCKLPVTININNVCENCSVKNNICACCLKKIIDHTKTRGCTSCRKKQMIIKNNEELLRVECSDVLLSEVGELQALLELELENSWKLGVPGIGLAAPQIGIAKKIAIIKLDRSKPCDIVLVNCKIEKSYDEMIFRNEGCLSFPGRVEDTKRFQEIYVVDNLIYPNSFVSTGITAIAIQHELDHLNQKLFFDNKVIVNNNKLKPNDICNCGSGKKYKKCCRR
jgi:peptide deformylase